MKIKSNCDLKLIAKKSGVYLYEIAEVMGMADSAFSRKLRHELPDDERAKILSIIRELSEGVS